MGSALSTRNAQGIKSGLSNGCKTCHTHALSAFAKPMNARCSSRCLLPPRLARFARESSGRFLFTTARDAVLPMSRDEYLQLIRMMAKRGEALPHAKLTADDVRTIRAVGLSKTARQLAEEFGVHHRTVEKIRSYETWRHVI